jgi:chromosome segregation ATPase
MSEGACVSLFRGVSTDGGKQHVDWETKCRWAVARELDQLKRKVKELTLRLEHEAKARKLDAQLAEKAKKLGEKLSKETKILREQGRKLASQLKSTLSDASKRDQAVKETHTKIAELRDELGRKTADLKRKSGELKKLAKESAHRAARIIRGNAKPSATSVGAESVAPAAPSEPDLGSGPSNKPNQPSCAMCARRPIGPRP